MIKNLWVILIIGMFLVSWGWAKEECPGTTTPAPSSPGHVVPERPPSADIQTSQPAGSMTGDRTLERLSPARPGALDKVVGKTVMIGNTEFRVEKTETGETFLVPTGKKIEIEIEKKDEKKADDEWATEESVGEYTVPGYEPEQKPRGKKVPSSSKKAIKKN